MSRRPARHRLAGLLVLLAVVGASAPTDALELVLDPLRSVVEGPGGSSEPLTGALHLQLPALPLGDPAPFAIESVSVMSSGGTSFRLDPTLTTAALGLLDPDGSFEILTLFLRIEGSETVDLAVPDLTGSVGFGSGGTHVISLSTSFEVISDLGTSTVTIAAVPEPGTAALVGLGAFGLAALGRRTGPR